MDRIVKDFQDKYKEIIVFLGKGLEQFFGYIGKSGEAIFAQIVQWFSFVSYLILHRFEESFETYKQAIELLKISWGIELLEQNCREISPILSLVL